MPPQHVYLDSDVLVPLTIDAEFRDQEQWARGIIGQLDGQSNSHEIYGKIPQICIGEVVNKYHQKLISQEIPSGYQPPQDTFLDRLFSIMDRIEGEFVSTNTPAQSLATALTSDNSRITNQDALIAATAIKDRYSTRLITTDDAMINSPEIRERGARGSTRDYDLVVTDSY